jgi:hypothetical protein
MAVEAASATKAASSLAGCANPLDDLGDDERRGQPDAPAAGGWPPGLS